MAFDNGIIWEINPSGSDSANGGGFSPAATMATDLEATSANTASPVVTSASYNFISRDEGHFLFIKSGTDSKPGWWKIVSTSANAATLDAAIGSGVLYNGATPNNLTAGISNPTIVLSGITWSIDYSRSTTPAIAYIDMLVGATTTQFTSVLNPVGPNIVGNVIKVTSGATVQRVEIVSTSTITATCDKTLGTAAQVGVGGLGGALSTPGLSGSLTTSSSWVSILGPATFNMSASVNVSGGVVQPSAGSILWFGYTSYPNRHPFNTIETDRPILQSSANNNFLISTSGANVSIHSLDFENGNASTGTTAFWDHSGGSSIWNCKFHGMSIAMDIIGTSLTEYCFFDALTNATSGIATGGAQNSMFKNCVFQNFTKLAISVQSISGCVFYANGAASANLISIAKTVDKCLFYGTTGSSSICLGSSVIAIENCVFVNNAATSAVCISALASDATTSVINCAFFGNTADVATGATYPGFKIINKVVLTGDPIVNPAAGDFSLNDTAGAGLELQGMGFPLTLPGTTTTTGNNIGPSDSTSGGGGGATAYAF